MLGRILTPDLSPLIKERGVRKTCFSNILLTQLRKPLFIKEGFGVIRNL